MQKKQHHESKNQEFKNQPAATDDALDPESLNKVLSAQEPSPISAPLRINQVYNDIDMVTRQDESQSEDRILAVIAYLWILSLIPYYTIGYSDFVKYHAKQGFVLSMVITAWMFLWLLLFYFVDFGMWIVWAVNVLILFWVASGIYNAFSGEKKPLFLLGKLAEKIKDKN